MSFIIDGNRIEFENYRSLSDYRERFDFVDAIIDLLDHWYDESEGFIEFMSSGSTGSPKSIKHSKQSILKSVNFTQKYFNYKSGDLSLLCLPLDSVAGKMMVIRSLITRLDLVLKSITSLVGTDLTQSIDFVAMTPFQLYQNFKKSPNSISNFGCILLGGSPVPGKLLDLIRGLDIPVFQSFGMTETITHVAIRRLNGSKATEYFVSVDPTIKFTLSQENCLVINTKHLTQEIVTNDLVKLVNEQMFYWKGRKDNIINSGGIKIIPELMEDQLAELFSENLIIISEPDESLGHRIVLVIESDDKNSLKNRVLEIPLIYNFKVNPKRLYVLPRFVFTRSGKINRKETGKLIDMQDVVLL